jgi:hypothetical protein
VVHGGCFSHGDTNSTLCDNIQFHRVTDMQAITDQKLEYRIGITASNTGSIIRKKDSRGLLTASRLLSQHHAFPRLNQDLCRSTSPILRVSLSSAASALELEDQSLESLRVEAPVRHSLKREKRCVLGLVGCGCSATSLQQGEFSCRDSRAQAARHANSWRLCAALNARL